MATSLDMSLDDLIKNRGQSERVRGRGRARRGRGNGRASSGGNGRASGGGNGRASGGGRIPGGVRRGPLSVNARPSSYTIAKSIRRTRPFPWQRDLLEDSLRAAGISGIEIGTKLYVFNLDYGVTNDDIRELFSEIGDLKRYAVHYDKNGRPTGSAEVIYTRRSDAFAALKRYNNVLLDGKPMKIEIIGSNAEMPISARVNVTGVNGRRKRTVVMTPGVGPARGSAVVSRGSRRSHRGGPIGREGPSVRGGPSIRGGPSGRGRARGRGWGRGVQGGQGRGGQGQGRGKKQPVDKSADDLDLELDNYHAEAMNTS